MEHSACEMFEMHVIVKGQVQGVGFRSMTRYYALELKLQGSVKNLANGTVEICAQGTRAQLENLLKKLKEETSPGQIAEASVEYFPIQTAHHDFHILH